MVSINYRLSGEAKFPAQINDVKAAIRFIRSNANEYNLKPYKIAVGGISAGGNLAALARTSGGVGELEDTERSNSNVSDHVQAVVDWYGPINFLKMDEQFKASGIDGQVHSSPDSPESKLLGQQITLVSGLWSKLILKLTLPMMTLLFSFSMVLLIKKFLPI